MPVKTPDITVEDRAGNPVMVVAVKRHVPDSESLEETKCLLQQHPTRYGAIATLDQVLIFDQIDWSTPLVVLNTSLIIKRYDMRSGTGAPSQYYLGTLIESWLLDLGQRLYDQTPPYIEDLARSGVLPTLADTIPTRGTVV